MNAPAPMNAPDIPFTRAGLLAAASVVIATCSVAVTLAVTSGGGGTDEPAATKPGAATPDAATPDRHRAMDRRR